MGSSSDWETMQHAVDVLDKFGVPNEKHVMSAHRTPDVTSTFSWGAQANARAGVPRRRPRSAKPERRTQAFSRFRFSPTRDPIFAKSFALSGSNKPTKSRLPNFPH